MAFGSNPALDAARSYATDAASGKFLGEGNPYLTSIANDTANDVTDRIQSAFGQAGRTGSGANQLALTKGLASSRNSLMASEYDSERQRQAQAAGMIPSLDAAQYAGLGAYLDAARGYVGIPLDAASQYSSSVNSLMGPYSTQTQKSSPGLGLIMAQIAGQAASGWASGGFK